MHRRDIFNKFSLHSEQIRIIGGHARKKLRVSWLIIGLQISYEIRECAYYAKNGNNNRCETEIEPGLGGEKKKGDISKASRVVTEIDTVADFDSLWRLWKITVL